MLLFTVLACWGDPPPSSTDAALPPVEVPVLPAAPPRGVGEVTTPPELTRATQVTDQEPPTLIDVQVNFDHGTFAGVQGSLTAWGFATQNADGETIRVSGEGADAALRLVALPEIARVLPVLERNRLPDGSFRKGSEVYGNVSHTWRWPDGSPVEEQVTGAVVAPAELPNALPAGALSCLGPLWEDVTMGVSVGVGWERALEKQGRWAVVVEGYGACDAKGWLVLTADAPVDHVTFGGRSVADADDAHFHDLAIAWLSHARPDLDPGVLAAVQLLGGADNAVLARAVRDAYPGQAQVRLLEAFTARDPDGALAVAGGATTPILRAQALGQNEEARKQVLADPASPPSAVSAALVGFRPGAGDGEAMARFLASPDPKVRARAWEAKFASTSAVCSARDPVKEAEAMYADCPASRTVIVDAARKRDAALAERLVSGTLSNPETVESGIAAVKTAGEAGMWPALIACADGTTAPRDVRRMALQALIAASRPEATELARRHGSFVGLPPALIPSPAVAGGAEK